MSDSSKRSVVYAASENITVHDGETMIVDETAGCTPTITVERGGMVEAWAPCHVDALPGAFVAVYNDDVEVEKHHAARVHVPRNLSGSRARVVDVSA